MLSDCADRFERLCDNHDIKIKKISAIQKSHTVYEYADRGIIFELIMYNVKSAYEMEITGTDFAFRD